MDGIAQGLHHHQHSGTTAVRPVIYRIMSIMGEITGIPRVQLEQAVFHGSTRNSKVCHGTEHLWEQGYYP
jgi:hypothetical protein